MIIFNWTISAVERVVTLEGLSDVIQTVHWRYTGTNDTGLLVEMYGATNVPLPNPQNFTPFSMVTALDVETWIMNILGEMPTEEEQLNGFLDSKLTRMRLDIEKQINEQITPTIIIGPLHAVSI